MDDIISKAQQLDNEQKYDTLLIFSDENLKILKRQTPLDSLTIANLYFHRFHAQYYQGEFLKSIESANLGIIYCPSTNAGLELKGMLYYKRAYGEGDLRLFKRSNLSMQKSANIWANMERPNLNYLVGAYIFIASKETYQGNLEEAGRNLRLAERVYLANKDTLDQLRTNPDGTYDRYEVILKYNKIYQLYSLGKTSADSLALLQTLKELTQLHDDPAFSTAERIYYSTSLNHVGTWYIEHEHDTLISEADLRTGLRYINQSIDLIENKGYPGSEFSFYFNKCKALTYLGELEEAEMIINRLLDKLNTNTGASSFFLAQKGLIKAKQAEQDSALYFFHKAISQVHKGSESLEKDYSNFQPSEVYGETRLILRIIERLGIIYKDDPEVERMIRKLYYLALVQFENSFQGEQFSPKHNLEIRQIMSGLLGAIESDDQFNSIDAINLVNRTETIFNQIAWKNFYQSTSISSLPQLDSLAQRHLSLRKQLAEAKLVSNLQKQDSLEDLISSHLINTKTLYANLNLLSSQLFNLQSLQKQLTPNELILKYLILDQQLICFQISTEDIQWSVKPWTEQIQSQIQIYLAEIKSLKPTTKSATFLSKYLIPNNLKTAKKLIINGDGLLNQIPFEALPYNGKYLIEDHTISYTSNLGFIHPLINRQTAKDHMALFLPDYEKPAPSDKLRNAPFTLLGAKEEAKAISEILPFTIYDGEEATKTQFIDVAPKASILHLAMHAIINSEEPPLSHLLFGTGQAADDQLFLEELYAIHLNADLAVLSACETGIGKEISNGHMESLQRAFTFAGVPSTVASLWKVPDQSTKTIMASFYKHLKSGEQKSVALQKAKLDYLRNTKQAQLKAPLYWAGFIMYGEDAPVFSKSNLFKYLGTFGVMLILLSSIVWFRKKYTAQ